MAFIVLQFIHQEIQAVKPYLLQAMSIYHGQESHVLITRLARMDTVTTTFALANIDLKHVSLLMNVMLASTVKMRNAGLR